MPKLYLLSWKHWRTALISACSIAILLGVELAQADGDFTEGNVGKPTDQSAFPIQVMTVDQDAPDVAKSADSDVFDDRDQFIPPQQLPIEQAPVPKGAGMPSDVVSERLKAKSVSRDGTVTLHNAPVSIDTNTEGPSSTEEDNTESAPEDAGVDRVPQKGGAAPLESVIGRDDRIPIRITHIYPFRAIGGIELGCTGTLIGPRHVLTAGHCVYNIQNDRWYSNLNFFPGRSGSYNPYGAVIWKEAFAPIGWTDYHEAEYDYALIVLNRNIGSQTGWLGFGWQEPPPNHKVNVIGYPGDEPDWSLWRAYCPIETALDQVFMYQCDTAPGMSGSAVYIYFKATGKRMIYGIHVRGGGGVTSNEATRLTRGSYEAIKSWKDAN